DVLFLSCRANFGSQEKESASSWTRNVPPFPSGVRGTFQPLPRTIRPFAGMEPASPYVVWVRLSGFLRRQPGLGSAARVGLVPLRRRRPDSSALSSPDGFAHRRDFRALPARGAIHSRGNTARRVEHDSR